MKSYVCLLVILFGVSLFSAVDEMFRPLIMLVWFVSFYVLAK